MPTYRVEWVIDLEADSPKGAAEEALRMHRDPSSIATVFHVYGQGKDHGEIDVEGDDDIKDDEEVVA